MSRSSDGSAQVLRKEELIDMTSVGSLSTEHYKPRHPRHVLRSRSRRALPRGDESTCGFLSRLVCVAHRRLGISEPRGPFRESRNAIVRPSAVHLEGHCVLCRTPFSSSCRMTEGFASCAGTTTASCAGTGLRRAGGKSRQSCGTGTRARTSAIRDSRRAPFDPLRDVIHPFGCFGWPRRVSATRLSRCAPSPSRGPPRASCPIRAG